MELPTVRLVRDESRPYYWLSFALSIAIAAAPLLLSIAIRPWAYSVEVLAESDFDLPGETTLLRLARVESLELYTGTLQTLLTKTTEWPYGSPRDACLIGIAPKDADTAPPTSVWTDRTIRRMFQDRVDPMEARRSYYEGEATNQTTNVNTETAAAIDFLRALEPYRAAVGQGGVRHFAIPANVEYRQRTGIRHIIGLAVEPTSLEPQGHRAKSRSSSVALAAPIARALREAGGRGVRFLAIPFIGATIEEGIDIDIYSVLLRAAIDTADNPGSLRALYVGAFADSPVRRKELIAAFNVAWQSARASLQMKERKPVDSDWRMASIMSLAAIVSVFVRRQIRRMSLAVTVKLSIAVILIAKGLSEPLTSVVTQFIPSGTAGPIWLLIATAAIVGWFLPFLALFDAKTILKGQVYTE
jgi:hypothetical protein